MNKRWHLVTAYSFLIVNPYFCFNQDDERCEDSPWPPGDIGGLVDAHGLTGVLLERLFPEAQDVEVVFTGHGGQQVGDVLEDLADGLRRDGFFLGLDAERGDQGCELLDVNHNQNSFR